MSIDLVVYASRPTVLCGAELVEALVPGGWEAAFPPSYVWVGGEREDRTATGPVGGVLYGWPLGSPHEADLVELVRRIPLDAPSARVTARGRLDQLGGEGLVGGCEIASGPYELDPEERAELAASGQDDLVGRLEQARTIYVVRTSVGRTEQSALLQDAVWRTIAAVTGGLRHAPSTGSWGDA